MGILKRLARFTLRTELQTLETKIKELNSQLDRELLISQDLKIHFRKRSIPVDFYKVLTDTQLNVNTLAGLKDIYLTVKGKYEMELQNNNLFLSQYSVIKQQEGESNIMIVDQLEKIKADNEVIVAKYKYQVETLEEILSKLNGIID